MGLPGFGLAKKSAGLLRPKFGPFSKKDAPVAATATAGPPILAPPPVPVNPNASGLAGVAAVNAARRQRAIAAAGSTVKPLTPPKMPTPKHLTAGRSALGVF